MVPLCFGLPLSFKIPCCSWIIVLYAVRFFYVFEQQLSKFYACSPKSLSQVLSFCNSRCNGPTPFFIWRSHCCHWRNSAASFLLFSLIIQLYDRYIHTHSPAYRPTYSHTFTYRHTQTEACTKRGEDLGCSLPTDVQYTESIPTTITNVLRYLPFSRNRLMTIAP